MISRHKRRMRPNMSQRHNENLPDLHAEPLVKVLFADFHVQSRRAWLHLWAGLGLWQFGRSLHATALGLRSAHDAMGATRQGIGERVARRFDLRGPSDAPQILQPTLVLLAWHSDGL